MMMIVLHLLSLPGPKCRCHRHFSPRPPEQGVFSGGAEWLDSWTLGPKPLSHRHPTGPHPSGLLWTPWTPAKGESTKSNFALVARIAKNDARATGGVQLRTERIGVRSGLLRDPND